MNTSQTRHHYFVAGTGTGIGKTTVAAALARKLRDQGRAVAAVKPIETGCNPDPVDAQTLAEACGIPALAHAAGFYRALEPLAPRAIAFQASSASIDCQSLAAVTTALIDPFPAALVESAGGIAVPLTRTQTNADLAGHLGLPIIMVAPNALGTLSHTITACHYAESFALPIAAIVLSTHQLATDPSTQTNARILRESLPYPVIEVPHSSTRAPLPQDLLNLFST